VTPYICSYERQDNEVLDALFPFFLFIWTRYSSSLFLIPSVGYKTTKLQKMLQYLRHNLLYIPYLALLQLGDMMLQLDSHGLQVKQTADVSVGSHGL
jgi:hypothetical protein